MLIPNHGRLSTRSCPSDLPGAVDPGAVHGDLSTRCHPCLPTFLSPMFPAAHRLHLPHGATCRDA